MSPVDDIILKLNVSTKDLQIQVIQESFMKLKNLFRENHKQNDEYEKILVSLWLHLTTGFNEFDDQLFCSTCYYTVLGYTDQQDLHLKIILETAHRELYKSKSDDDSKTAFVMSVIYGMFQSCYLLQIQNSNLLETVLQAFFDLLVFNAYKYSQYTFITFKILSFFKKLIGSDKQNSLLNKENQLILLNIINHNWENPITGIRNLNRTIFQCVLTILESDVYDTILKDINNFYWNKAKYLMLSEIIEQSTYTIDKLLHGNDWIEGIMYSLHKPGLVSAGADMYYAILKKLKSDDEWCETVLSKIMDILCSTSDKATENFLNYWWLSTLKLFPSLISIILNKLESCENTEKTMYSVLGIIRQGIKLNLRNYEWNSECSLIENAILSGIQHCNTSIRVMAFDIVSMGHRIKLPTEIQCTLILNYLHNNINSDCTVLRINMINSLNYYLMHISMNFTNVSKVNNDDRNHWNTFYRKLQELIVTSLNFNGNYQRKITTIKVTDIIFKSLKAVPKKRQKNVKSSKHLSINMLAEKGVWLLYDDCCTKKLISLLKDSADDVKYTTLELLLKHYMVELKHKHIIEDLVEEATKSIRSKYFYKINCGQILFKLVANIILREKPDGLIFKTIEDLFNFAYYELHNEFKLNREIVEAIEQGKQLHAYISILHAILDVSFENSYTLQIQPEIIMSLLDMLDGISSQFAWEQESSTSSDFSKMNDMIENIIQKSGYNNNSEDETKISGLHQIVLNSIWLNVKASCDLASLLILYYKKDTSINVCEKSLNIIIHVLETSRHKGAIEAAGVALGKSIQHLTSLTDSSVNAGLPLSLLMTKLSDFVRETIKMASVTRRGAGLSIMVHRIACSDMKKGKPLFHYFMNTFLERYMNVEDLPSGAETNDIDNEKDLPKAIYIHFLTKIVTDSSLASDVMFYSRKLAQLAFENLTNSHWQIRNAALQLYGALIQKLIGQKKPSGTDEEVVASVACDEFRSHSPELWKYILVQLNLSNYGDYNDQIQRHSNVVPILNILANFAKRYNFSFSIRDQEDCDYELLKSLTLLLGSPIHAVRCLTAKCISNIYPLQTMENILMQTPVSENDLHGKLVLLEKCYKMSSHEHNSKLKNISDYYISIIESGSHSYLCKEKLESTLFHEEFCVKPDFIEETIAESSNKAHEPGIHYWANMRIVTYLLKSEWNKIPAVLNHILSSDDFDKYCEIISKRVDNDSNIPREALAEIHRILLTKTNTTSWVWKILYQISIHFDLNEDIDLSFFLAHLQNQTVLYKIRYMIPYAARLLANYKERTSEIEDALLHLSEIIFSLSDPETSDIDMRFIATISNNELGNGFYGYENSIKTNVIKTAIILLQDSDEDIRNLSVIFYKNLNVGDNTMLLQPYICLGKIMNREFLCNIFSEPESNIMAMCNDLSNYLFKSLNIAHDEYNPFASDLRNIYIEIEVFKHLMGKLIKK